MRNPAARSFTAVNRSGNATRIYGYAIKGQPHRLGLHAWEAKKGGKELDKCVVTLKDAHDVTSVLRVLGFDR